MLKIQHISALVVLTLLPTRGKAQEGGLQDSIFSRLGERYIADGHSDGLSIAVVRDGRAHFYNFGVTSRDHGRRPTARTVYEIGSISKAFTSLLLAHAVSEGKVRLNDDIRAYLP